MSTLTQSLTIPGPDLGKPYENVVEFNSDSRLDMHPGLWLQLVVDPKEYEGAEVLPAHLILSMYKDVLMFGKEHVHLIKLVKQIEFMNMNLTELEHLNPWFQLRKFGDERDNTLIVLKNTEARIELIDRVKSQILHKKNVEFYLAEEFSNTSMLQAFSWSRGAPSWAGDFQVTACMGLLLRDRLLKDYPEYYEALTLPWRRVVGRIHPDDRI